MIYSFGDTVLDEHRRALYRGADWIMVEPKVFDVLLYLVKNRDRVVMRQELLEACWPNVYVSDGTLSRCVSRVRQAVSQSRSAAQPIFTLHGKGYRFVDPVTVSAGRESEGAAESVREAEAVKPVTIAEAERRVISVVDFALDLTCLRSSADAESLYDALDEFGSICSDVARRYGGTYEKPTCEGAELRFGEPGSAERAAESAVLAGFDLLERARERGMKARVGIASGRAIVKPNRDGEGRFCMVVEIDPLRPACLRAKAAAHQCVVDDTTRRAVEAAFTGKALGDVAVGDGDVPVYLLSPRPVQLAPCAENMPFFGRSSELAFLEHCWRYAACGQGQTVNVMGAMGVGKTRLIQELTGRLELGEDAQLRLRCSPHHRDLPFYPLALLLRDLLGRLGGAAQKREETAVQALLSHFGLEAADHLANLVPLLTALQSVGKQQLQELAQPEQRDGLVQSLASLLLAAAGQRPMVFWVDDIQWADTATLAVVEEVRAQVARSRLLIILAGRPKGGTGPAEAAGATSIVLHPFSQAETRRYLNSRCDGPALSAKVIDWMVERCDGVPLFLREILRLALARCESKSRRMEARLLADAEIPRSLHWQLQSLLDEAGTAKQVVQWAAMLGRSFTSTILAGVSKIPAEELEAALDHLTAIGLLSEGGCGRSTSFSFNHELVRDFAYESMLGRQRRRRHREIADTLIAEFPHVAARDPESVATHLEVSDAPERAAEYWRLAQGAGWGTGKAAAKHGNGAVSADATLELLSALPAAGHRDKALCGPRRRVA